MKKAPSQDCLSDRSVARIVGERKTLSEPVIYGGDMYFNGARLYIQDKLCKNIYSMILKVRHERSNKLYVVKLLNTPFDNDKRSSDFKKEIKMLRRLQSKHVIKYYGEIESPVGRGILLKYYPSGTVYNFLNSGKFTIIRKMYRQMCIQVVAAIEYLHQQTPAIVHRDIKSPNYLLTRRYSIKLCDFGLSRADTEDNRTSTLENWRTTPAWSAPEIVDNRYTKESDIYSLGIVLWEILFTHFNKQYSPPFDGYDKITIASRLFVVPELRPPLDGIPTMWGDLLEKMWAANPQSRPSCSKLLASINKIKKLYKNK